jgi:hypothetical protein
MIDEKKIAEGVKKWIGILKKECPECYEKLEKCCDEDCCK